MPARKPLPHKTVGGLPVAAETFAAAAAPIEGELVTLKAAAPKPGWTTSEFWLALAPLVGAALTVFHVTAAPAQVRDVLIAIAGLVGAAYALSRGIVKAAHMKATVGRQLPPLDAEAGYTPIELLVGVLVVVILVLLVVFLAHQV